MTAVHLSIETAGTGTPLVLTHGLGDCAGTWDAMWDRLVDRHTVTRWDLRGHGRSDAPVAADAYSPAIAEEDLLTVIARCDHPVTLIGHSLGGFVSLAVALRRPDLVRSVVMISSGPGFRDPAAREEWNHYVDTAAQSMPIAPGAAQLAHQLDSFVIDTLDELARPLTQIVGQHDRRFHRGVEFIQSRIPHCTTHVIAGAAHNPHRSHPDEVLAVLDQGTQPGELGNG